MSEITGSAPLLSALREKGGTLYTLSSAINDFTYLFNDSDIRVIPSKFVALKLPKWANTTTHSMYIDPLKIGDPYNSDPNYVFPKIIQNYTENLNQYSGSDKQDNLLSNYGEQAFWKMLTKLGCFELVATGETIEESGKTKNIYKERDSDSNYEQIIQFVGDINQINQVKRNGVEYNEIFLNIPTNAGRMAEVKFKPIDFDFTTGQLPSAGGSETTVGLDDFIGTDSVSAVYDNEITRQYEVANDVNDAGVWFQDVKDNEDMHNQGDFEFNSILIYYDVFDKNDMTTLQTCAYGLLLLNKFDLLTGGSGEFQNFKKYQPDEFQPGNAFSERLNIKFSNYTNQTTSEVTINSFSTVSMELYSDALRRLGELQSDYDKLTNSLLENQATIDEFRQYLYNAEELNDSLTDISTLQEDVEKLKTWQSGTDNVRISNEELFNLFTQVSNSINSGEAVVNNDIILSNRLYLPKVVDVENLIVEDPDLQRYQWNGITNQWESI